MRTNTIRNCAVALMLINVMLLGFVSRWHLVSAHKTNDPTTHTVQISDTPHAVYRLVLNREVDNADNTIDVLSSVVLIEIDDDVITFNELD